MYWWFDIVGPVWAVLAVIMVVLAAMYWSVDPAYSGTKEREQELRVGAIMILAGLFAPLTIVWLVIYGFIWLVRTALGK